MEKFKGCDLQGTGLRGTPKVLSLGALSSSHSEDWREKKKNPLCFLQREGKKQPIERVPIFLTKSQISYSHFNRPGSWVGGIAEQHL